MADTKTYLKVPYRTGTLRSLPFNGGHLTALTMAKQLKDPRRQINVVLKVLNRLLGDDAYEQITNDFVDGEVAERDLLDLLDGIVHATAAYHKAQQPDALQDALDRGEPQQTDTPVPETFRADRAAGE